MTLGPLQVPSCKANSVDYNETCFVLEKIFSMLLSPNSFEVLYHYFEELIPYFLIFYFDTEIPCKEAEPCN